ncbi:hypothetical protein ScPMuIL_017218 [Solemya velum]
MRQNSLVFTFCKYASVYGCCCCRPRFRRKTQTSGCGQAASESNTSNIGNLRTLLYPFVRLLWLSGTSKQGL